LKIRKISNGYLKTEFDEFLLNFDLDLKPNPQISAKISICQYPPSSRDACIEKSAVTRGDQKVQVNFCEV